MKLNQHKLALVFVSALLGVILVVLHLGINEIKNENHSIANSILLKVIANKIQYNIFENLTNTTTSLAEMSELKKLLVNSQSAKYSKILTILETVKQTSSANIVYIMNRQGTVVASTVSDNTSLLHNNYYFRPYFTKAIQGKTVIYPAIGVTTGKRGIYFSSPVKHNNKNIGVVVIKLGLGEIDAILNSLDKTTLLISREGIIFSTNKKKWLYKTLTNLPEKIISDLKSTRQFSDIEFSSLDFKIYNDRAIKGNQIFFKTSIDLPISQWKIILLDDLHQTAPLTTMQKGFIITIFFSLIIIFSIFIILILLSNRKAQAEQKYRLVVENANEGILILDSNFNIVFNNQKVLTITEYDKEEFIRCNFLNIIHDDHKQNFITNTNPKENGLYTSQHFETKIKTKYGSFKWLIIGSVKVVWNNRNAILLFLIDNTEKKQAEKELVRSEKKYRLLVESMNEGVVILDNESIIVYVNNAFRKLLGIPSDIIGFNLDELIRNNKNITSFAQTNRIQTETKATYNWEWTVDNDNKKFCLVNESVLLDDLEQKTGSILVISDLTDLNRLQEKLIRSEKMEVIGRLAGGVAHDLNNILSGLVSIPDLLIHTNARNQNLVDSLQIIKLSGEKAAAIVNDLLTLSRRQVFRKEIINLNEIIIQVLSSHNFLKFQSEHEEVDVKSSLADNLYNISGSALYLENTIMNLITNSMEAMPDGGTLSIKTYNDIENKKVFLEISDTGVGISDKDKEKIFEPFYTKKVMRRSGTGLGLAIVWTSIKDHSGTIRIKNNEVKGTTFIISIPATMELMQKEKQKAEALPKGDNQRILVVDDDQLQRNLVRDILKHLNYHIFDAADSQEAMAIIQNNDIQLVLLDMILDNGENGIDIFKLILEKQPALETKTIFVTGYAESNLIDEAKELGAQTFIKKPYKINTLATEVHKKLYSN